MRVVLFGAPGAGKGTQGEAISRRYGIPHLSTGGILRGLAESGDPLGVQVKGILDRGDLVDDAMMFSVIKARLGMADCSRGYVLDGYPRTIEQVHQLEGFLLSSRLSLDLVLVFLVDPERVRERLAARDSSENRGDDAPDVVARRLDLYRNKAGPVLNHYRSNQLLHNIDATGAIADVSRLVFQILDPLSRNNNRALRMGSDVVPYSSESGESRKNDRRPSDAGRDGVPKKKKRRPSSGDGDHSRSKRKKDLQDQ